MNGTDPVAHAHQSFQREALARFDRDGEVGKLRQPLAADFPTFRRVVEAKLSGDSARHIQDQYVMMILSPIEPREVCDFIPCLHVLRFLSYRCGSPAWSYSVQSRTNTVALMGRSSLRL